MKWNDMVDLMSDAYIKFETLNSTTRDRMIRVLDEMEKAGMRITKQIPMVDESDNEWTEEVIIDWDENEDSE